jgi:hypothetical protein
MLLIFLVLSVVLCLLFCGVVLLIFFVLSVVLCLLFCGVVLFGRG